MRVQDEFAKSGVFKMIYGRSARFWLDLWCDHRPLRKVFSNLYHMALDHYTPVAGCLLLNGSGLVCKPRFRTALED